MAKVIMPDGETEPFLISITGVLQGDTLALYLFCDSSWLRSKGGGQSMAEMRNLASTL